MLKLAYKVESRVVQWLARLPGTQEIRGMTDFLRQYSFAYINACIVQLSKSSKILNSDTVEHV